MAIVLNGTTGITGNSGTLISASTIGVGGATPAASGAGITFPATASASSDANTLDDYEEGSWSPTVGGNATYTTQAGKYTKIGNQVTAWFDMQINVIGTGSATTLSGLPFTSANDGVQGRGVSIGYFVDLNVSVVCLVMRLDANATSFGNATLGAAGASVSNGSSIFKSATRITGTITYNT